MAGLRTGNRQRRSTVLRHPTAVRRPPRFHGAGARVPKARNLTQSALLRSSVVLLDKMRGRLGIKGRRAACGLHWA